MKEIFKLSKREKKIAKKALEEAQVREFTEEEAAILLKKYQISKEKVKRNFMKYGAAIAERVELEEALKSKMPYNAKAKLTQREKEILERYKSKLEILKDFESGNSMNAGENYRKKLMENMKESEGAKHYSFMISGGRIYNSEEIREFIMDTIKELEEEELSADKPLSYEQVRQKFGNKHGVVGKYSGNREQTRDS